MEDSYKTAARSILDGDTDRAWALIETNVKENAYERYEPEHDADEDGVYVDFNRPASKVVYKEIDFSIDAIATGMWEILEMEGLPDEEIQRVVDSKVGDLLDLWYEKYGQDIVDDLVETWKDNAAYSSDPYSYYGVRRSDF